MIRIRLCEESLVEPILRGEVKCPVHLYSGQEAIAAGVCATLDEKDYIFGTHRSHGHYLAKGGGMRELVAEVFCKEAGCSKGRGGSMHIIDSRNGMIGSVPIVAGTIPLALGAALASKIRKENYRLFFLLLFASSALARPCCITGAGRCRWRYKLYHSRGLDTTGVSILIHTRW